MDFCLSPYDHHSNSLHHTAINQHVQPRWPQVHIRGCLRHRDGRPHQAFSDFTPLQHVTQLLCHTLYLTWALLTWYHQQTCLSTACVLTFWPHSSFLKLGHLGWYVFVIIPILSSKSFWQPLTPSFWLGSDHYLTWSPATTGISSSLHLQLGTLPVQPITVRVQAWLHFIRPR